MPVAQTQDLLDRKFDVCFTHGDINGNGVLDQPRRSLSPPVSPVILASLGRRTARAISSLQL